MSEFFVRQERLRFGGDSVLPQMDLVVGACRGTEAGAVYDVLDFRRQCVDRWTVPALRAEAATDRIRKRLRFTDLPMGVACAEEYFQALCMTPHTAQIARSGCLLVGLGDPCNGFCVLTIDASRARVRALPDGWQEGRFLYGSTGGFRRGGTGWVFLRWPFDGAMDIAEGRAKTVPVEILELDTDSHTISSLACVDAVDAGHQVTCSPDGRYAVFAPFKWDLKVPYPAASPAEDPVGYRRSHDAGIRLSPLYTVDLQSGQFWQTAFDVPVIAHAHFDPREGDVFYLSAHNICPTRHGIMVEGPAAIYRVRVGPAGPHVEGTYTDGSFFRIPQHSVFYLDDRPLIAVTNLPNHLEIIDARTMTLWRRRKLFESPALDLSATGNALCPTSPGSCLALCVSEDGRYVVLESAAGLRVYDIQEDCLFDSLVSQRLPKGARPVGHMRTPGE